jgi:hypothetical protein
MTSRFISSAAARIHHPPVAGKEIVGPPAEQERVGPLVQLLDERHGLAVEVPHGPSVALESGHVFHLRRAVSCITPSTETCVVVVSFMIAVPFSPAPLAGGLSPLPRTPGPDPTPCRW